MQDNKHQMDNKEYKFPRVLLFILSMAPFFVILGLMTMDIPVSWGPDSEFIGWYQLWVNTRIGWLIIVVSSIIEVCIYYLFNHVCTMEAGEESEIIDELEDKNFELISFVTSIFLPLISFQYNQLSHWVVTVLIVLLIGYIFCHSDGFYTNPTLAIFRCRLYKVKLGNQRQGEGQSSRDLTILSTSELQAGDRVRCVKLSAKVSFANKT